MSPLPVALLFSVALVGPALAEPPPMAHVTTDSRTYCDSLINRLHDMPRGAREPSRSLGRQGEHLCQAGYFKAGVTKLRRAIRAAEYAGGTREQQAAHSFAESDLPR